MAEKASDNSDAQLVERALAGDRTAFATIVERYQSLVCSITYNATGSLTLSEDLAQETFLAAWKQLSHLREPARLRSWLCGITRLLVGKERRRQTRDLVHAAESLDQIQEPPSPEASLPMEGLSRQQEEAILWRALERMPDAYREPLILFYREEKSILRVAADLDLSEDAVKQRLSRGRKMLQDEVIAFVEGALRRTAPGRDFSSAVVAMLPTTPAVSAGAGIAGKGAALLKAGSSTAWLMPFTGVAAAILVNWLSSRAAPTARERSFKRFWFFSMLMFALLWSIPGQWELQVLCQRNACSSETALWAAMGFWGFYCIVATIYVVFSIRRSRSMRRQIEGEPGKKENTGTPLTDASALAFIAAVDVASFSWLIVLAIRAGDWFWAAVIAGIMVALFVWQSRRSRKDRAEALASKSVARHIALAFAIILLIVNRRLPDWIAASWTVNSMHGRLPSWVMPLTTLFLLFLAGIVVAFTRSPRAVSQSQQR